MACPANHPKLNKTVRVAVTGAAGNIGYALLFRLASGAVFGPNTPVQLQLQKETGAKIGLIPCADGGTRISQWQPGEVLFDHAVFQARLAQRTSALTAILWHQGESDCLAPEQLEAYPEQFQRTMQAFRKELGDLPIVVGELGWPENGFHGTPAELLHEFNRRLPEWAAQLPRCAVVSAKGLTARPDGLHFTTEALRTLGLRYLEAYQSLL